MTQDQLLELSMLSDAQENGLVYNRDMKRLAVINCRAGKMSHPARANEMYSVSPAFAAMRRFCEQHYDDYIILSAKHGILRPEQVIAPYKKCLPNQAGSANPRNTKSPRYGEEIEPMTRDEAKVWATAIINNPLWRDYGEIDLHLSEVYRYWIEDSLKKEYNVRVAHQPRGVMMPCVIYPWLSTRFSLGDRDLECLNVGWGADAMRQRKEKGVVMPWANNTTLDEFL